MRAKPFIWVLLAMVYALLLAASNIWADIDDPEFLPDDKRGGIPVPVFDADGRAESGGQAIINTLDIRRFDERGLPVVFLHGSPGGLDNVAGLEPYLNEAGRRTITLDLPGFGASDWDLPDLGSLAHARYVLAFMDELGVRRAHLVGWSNGGAVGLNMADIAPDRVASVTLLASVGVQETEGSGSYLFEHAKYRAGLVVFRGIQLLTPHFGLFGSRGDLAWLRNFDDTDQRPLRGIMASLRTPTLILHGRHDFLTSDWGAELHHRIIPTSRLVMLDGSHFLPMPEPIGQARESAEVMEAFFVRHDTPGVAPITTYDDRAPKPERAGVARAIEWVGERLRWTPWWAVIAGLALLARWRPELAAVLAGMYVGRVDLDFLVAFLGVFVGRMTRAPTPFDGKRLPLSWVGSAVWTGLALFAVFLAEQDTFFWHFGPDDAALRFGAIGFVAWVVLGCLVLHVVRSALRRRGRQRLRAQWTRMTNHEYWPSWVLYLPVVPIWIGRAFKPGGVLAFTAVNPGIPDGGGITGESKHQILRAMGDDPRVLAHEFVPAGGAPDERARRVLNALDERPELNSLPVVLKPDTGERGSDVRIARTEDRVRAYFETIRDDVVAQRYAPGPEEFGVLWIRAPEHVGREPSAGELAGRIFAITDKRFEGVTGDGKRTLGELILADRRGRASVNAIWARHRDRLGAVISKGEFVAFTRTGNHVQGCAFYDGERLITAALERTIDGIARSFEGGLDFGRFDVRCPSASHLARGEELSIVELNGVTSEATNHYDPEKPARFAWGVLRRQWRALYELADARIAAGAKPLSWRTFVRIARSQRMPTGVTD
ncbi:MAG: alpha/beta fold hydrolase [Phycisphaerales bacterium]